MGLINALIDSLDKKWGEQAMQKKINNRDEIIEEKLKRIDELWREQAELLREKEWRQRAKGDAGARPPLDQRPREGC